MKAAFVLLVLSLAVAQAQSALSKKLLAIDQAKQLSVWTRLLKQSDLPCDSATRSMFQGGSQGVGQDSWSVGCADGNEYSIGISYDAEGSTKILTCKELAAVNAMLMQRAGKPPGNDTGCWAKY
jgi:hypothetical protein